MDFCFQLTYNSLITSYLTTISDVGRNTNSNILMCKQNQNDGYLWSYGAINSSPIDSIKIMILTQSDEHYICNKYTLYKVMWSFMFINRKDLNLNFSLYNSLFRSDNISGISWWLIIFKIIFYLFLMYNRIHSLLPYKIMCPIKILDIYFLYVFAFFPYRHTYCSVSWALTIGDSI